MSKIKQLAFLLAVSTTFLTCKSVQAQWQWMPDVCGGYSDSWSANCRRDSNGNPIQRNRRIENTEVSPSSQFTRPQIYRFVDQIVSTAPNPQALRDLSYQVCRNNYRPKINGRRLTFEETVIFKERLGC
jgi:hypothetical protein